MKIEHRSNYEALRVAAYPSIESQLDDLWHAMHRGEIPIAKRFYENIKAVKERHPKPESIDET